MSTVRAVIVALGALGAGVATAAAQTPPAAAEPAAAVTSLSTRQTAGWLVVGTGIAFATVGGVLALSAEAAEKDLLDLYSVRIGDTLPTFEGPAQRRYDELVVQGERYELYSRIAFAAAGAAGVGAAILFLWPERDSEGVALVPSAGPGELRLSARARF